MSTQSTIQLLSNKLGIHDGKVISKSAEFDRLLQSKSVAGSNMTDTARIIACLDLAASYFGSDIDIKNAVKFAGLKTSSYMSIKKMVENLLELNTKSLTVTSLCLMLECPGVVELAENILKDYQKQSKMELDLNLPQYVCMSVHCACRLNKIKVSKNKLIEKSRLKPGQWSKMEASWSKFVEEKYVCLKSKKSKTKVIEENKDEYEMDVEITQEELHVGPEMEPYEVWKARMLKAAYEELSKHEHNKLDKDAPRRSPRKTPQKVTPYKPSANKTIRLLFPVS